MSGNQNPIIVYYKNVPVIYNVSWELQLINICRLLFIPFILLFISCKGLNDEDTTPPTVIVSSHFDGQIIGELVTIKVATEDSKGISKVEFFINDALVLTLTEPPFEYIWNTTEVDDGEYIIIIKSYDNSDNFSVSDPITLIVDNASFVPQKINVTNVTYDINQMTIIWSQAQDSDFNSYKLWQAPSFDGEKFLITTIENPSITSCSIQDFNPLVENWFWIEVEDKYGLSTIGDGMASAIDMPPMQLDVASVEIYVGKIIVEWDLFQEYDFGSYKLYRSDSENGDKEYVTTIDIRTNTQNEIVGFNQYGENWFWVEAVDYWDQTSLGNGMTGYVETNPRSIYLIFDGNGDRVRVMPNENIILPNEELTIEAWMKATNTPQQYQFLVSHGHSGPGYLLGWWSGAIWFRFKVLIDNQEYSFETNYPTESLEWMHVAGVYDGSTIKLYINGELKDSAPADGQVWTSPSISLNFGAFAGGGYYFNGALDEIRIWSTARSEQEINAYINELIVNESDGLIAYYRFNKGSSIIAKDYTDRGGDGEIVGPNWVIE